MRVIIEVDSDQELEQVAALLKSAVLKDQPITVQKAPSRRQAILQDLFRTYQGRLPEGWKKGREQAHTR